MLKLLGFSRRRAGPTEAVQAAQLITRYREELDCTLLMVRLQSAHAPAAEGLGGWTSQLWASGRVKAPFAASCGILLRRSLRLTTRTATKL